MFRRALSLFSLVALGALSGCAHDSAWVSSKNKHGGVIGYSPSSFSDDSEKVVRDFKKVAGRICGKRPWVVVKELIPPPTESVGAVREAAKGNTDAAVDLSGRALIHDTLYRSRRLEKSVKVEYGSPLKSWNEAEIKCSGTKAKAKS